MPAHHQMPGARRPRRAAQWPTRSCRGSLTAEVYVFDSSSACQREWVALEHNIPVLQDVDVAGDIRGEPGILLDEQNGGAQGSIDVLDDLEDVLHHQWSKAQRRFVQQNQSGSS